MSRSGYTDDYAEQWQFIMWRGAVHSAIHGKRGQAMLKELLAALDAMPTKELIAHDLECNGQYCALGVLGTQRGIALTALDPEDQTQVAQKFGIARALACEIVYMNDEGAWGKETPTQRWVRMRAWIASQVNQRGPRE